MNSIPGIALLLRKIIKGVLPYAVVRFLQNDLFRAYLDSKKVFKKYYLPKYGKPVFNQKLSTKTVIYFADGRENTGGLADRFRGIVSIYKISKELNVDFKIHMTSPVDLSNYLIPNNHNWIIDNKTIIYDIKNSIIFNFWCDKYTQDHQVLIPLKKSLKRWNQIHIRTNMGLAEYEYNDLFCELFKPADELKAKLEKCLSEIGCEFISVTFRFQQLLGDFIEEKFPILQEMEQKELITRCINHLIEIHNENKNIYKKILVTSDSITFLEKVKELDFVYVVPGKLAHVDYQPKEGKEVYMKSFLDYYLLTYSKMVYLVIDGQMYNSGFPYRAALHNLKYKIKRYG